MVDQRKADSRQASTRPHTGADGKVIASTVFTYEAKRSAFHALDASTGDELWSLGSDWGLSSIMVVDGVVYAHSLSGYLHTLEARTGEPIWSLDIGYQWRRRPFAVSEGVVYVGLPASNLDRGPGQAIQRRLRLCRPWPQVIDVRE